MENEKTCKNCKHTIPDPETPAGQTWFICRNEESQECHHEVDASWVCEKWEA